MAHAAPGPNAARVDVAPNGSSAMYGRVVIGSANPQVNENDANATIVDANAGIVREGTSTGNTDTVADNRIIANAGANSFVNGDAQVLSNLSGNDSEFGSGVAVSGVSMNYATVNSSVTESAIGVSLIDTYNGSVSNSGNTIAANTTLNSGTSIVGGTLSTAYEPTFGERGAIVGAGFDSEAESIADVRGTVAVSNVQVNDTAGLSSAMVDDVEVTLELSTTEGGTFSGSASLNANEVAANFKGNRATSGISVASSTAAFEGTASIGNYQVFDGTDNEFDFGSESSSSLVEDVSIRAIITGENFDEFNESTTLTGSLTVSGNTIASTARGNEVLAPTGSDQTYGNQISLADGMAFVGSSESSISEFVPGAIAAAFESSEFGLDNIAAVTGADLSIASVQTLDGSNTEFGRSVTSFTYDADIAAEVATVDGASVSVTDNVISASATGNAASSGIMNGANSAIFAGTAAISNAQSNYAVNVGAYTSSSEISLYVDDYESDADDSQLSVTGNRIASTAYGNDSLQAISLTATTLGTSNDAAMAGVMIGAMALGDFAIANAQIVSEAAIEAETNGYIELGSESELDQSSMLLSGNRIDAVAVASNAANTLSLTGTTMGGGAAIANLQGASNTFVSADTEASFEAFVEGDLQDGSSLSLTNNTARAVAYANSAANGFNVSAGTLNIDDATESTIFGGQVAGVSAAVALSNAQFASGAVNADVEGWVEAYIGDDVQDSSLTNSGNSLIAAAYGNQVSNAGTLSITNVNVNDGESEFGPGASLVGIANLQQNSASISAELEGRVYTYVESNVEDSAISNLNNLLQAVATANRADNTLTLTGTNISDGSDIGALSQSFGSGPGTIDAPIAMLNAQSTQSDIAARVNDSEYYGGVGIDIDSSVDSSSSLTATGNQQIANAIGNTANTALSLTAATLDAGSAVQNIQTMEGTAFAVVGTQGVTGQPGTPDQPFNYDVTVTSPVGLCSDGVCEVTGGTATVATQNLSEEQVIALINSGWTNSGGVLTRNASYLGTIPLQEFAVLEEAGTSGNGTVLGLPGQEGRPNGSGVLIAVYDGVNGSALTVANNLNAAAATGNNASTAVTLSATNMSSSGSASVAPGTYTADHMVGNLQSVGGSVTSQAFGTFAISANDFESETGTDLYNSSLDVSGNRQTATSFGNSAVTSLTLATTDASGNAPSAGLISEQLNGASVSATSDLDVFAPVASFETSITLNNNSNVATSIGNDVTNRVSATGTNMASNGGATVSSGSAQGGIAMRNFQQSLGQALVADANTVITNEESTQAYTGGQPVYEGVVSGSVSMNGNSTLAQAVANQATNSVALNAGATQGGSAALYNEQFNTSSVNSTATSTIGIGLNADGLSEFGALNAAGLTISGNSTVANARGNVAVNTGTATGGVGSTQNGFAANASGSFASAANVVLNSQQNTASINASATGITSAQALNGAVANSAVTIAGNTTSASAYGNAATNTLTVAQSAGASPSGAVVNNQLNSGLVTASVTNVTYGFNTNGSMTGSAAGVTGNTIGATAIGNSAVTAITTAR